MRCGKSAICVCVFRVVEHKRVFRNSTNNIRLLTLMMTMRMMVMVNVIAVSIRWRRICDTCIYLIRKSQSLDVVTNDFMYALHRARSLACGCRCARFGRRRRRATLSVMKSRFIALDAGSSERIR